MNYDNRLDEGYFRYLTRLIEWDQPSSPGGLNELAHVLYATPFSWLIPRDANRAQDALEMRHEFIAAYVPYADHNWVHMDASVLEVLIALAQRCSFQTEGALSEARTTGAWLLILLDNLGLLRLVHLYGIDMDEWRSTIIDILHRWMFRAYAPDGSGGLFPLASPTKDQRLVELWEQASAYLIEELERAGFFL